MSSLGDVGLFMLDMDGTFYLGRQLLPGAAEFLGLCRQKGIQFTFVTNNSSKSPADYLQKLAGMGVEVSRDEMLTSADATLLYMEEQALPRDILLVGTPSLERQFTEAGYTLAAAVQAAKAVVLGFDTTLSYEKLTKLCNAVRAGLPYIATHPDFNCPVEGGYIPDIGAVIAFVQAATGRQPDEIIGKPNAAIARAAARRFGLPLQKLCMVGDRLYTDIALGSCGVQTALVLSGESTRADAANSPHKPDYIFENLAELAAALQNI